MHQIDNAGLVDWHNKSLPRIRNQFDPGIPLMDDIHPKDFKYVQADPDPDFDPKRNQEVMAEVVRESEEYARKKRKENEEGIRERADAAATYLKSLEMGGKESNINKYFGRRQMAYLRGMEVLEQLKQKFKK